MELFEAYCPDIAGDETKVVELAFGSDSRPRTVAFVERYCDEQECDCRRVTLQLLDVDHDEELAAVGWDFDADRGADGRLVYFERTSRGGIEAHLLRAIVEGYIVHTDYSERLKSHYREFRRAVEAGEQPETSHQGSSTNGVSRPLQDYSAAEEVSLADVRTDWKRRAERPTELNRILQLFFDARRGWGDAFSGAMTILDGLGIDVDRHEVVAASEAVENTRFYPPPWRSVLESKWTIERPLVDNILPLVAEALWERWTDAPRPHLTTKLISGGYEARYEQGPEHAFDAWKKAWRHVEVWLDSRGGVPQKATLTQTLDAAVDIAEDSHTWLHDIGRLVRQMLRGGDISGETAVEAVDLLASISGRLTGDELVLKNNLDVARYASLRDLGRDDEARRLLDTICQRPTDDPYAGLFLAHMIALWDYQTTHEQLELVLEFIDATLELARQEDGRLLREVRDKLRV